MSFSFPITTAEEARIVREVYQWMGRKKAASYAAERIGISEPDYLLVREQIQDLLDKYEIDLLTEKFLVGELEGVPEVLASTTRGRLTSLHNTDVASAVTEHSEDLEKGESTLKGISSVKPRTAEEVISLLQIDTTQWSLKQYWNKEKAGRWEISALVAKKKAGDYSHADIELSLAQLFAEANFSSFVLPVIEGNGRALFLYSADKHVGADVAKVAMFGNHYSAQIYQERMQKVLDEVGYLVEQSGCFDKIYYVDLGDHTDGQDGKTVSKSHHLPQNLSNRETFDTCVQVEIGFLHTLFESGYAKSYEVLQNANSNHSGDFDYYVSRAIELYCNIRFPEVKTQVLEKFIEHIDYGPHTILLCHGKDDGDMKHGLPKHLNEKTENYLRRYMQFHGLDVNERYVTFAKADLHQNASEQVYGLRYRNAASLFGSSKWIQTNFGPGAPGCSYDIVDRNSYRVLEGLIRF